MYLKKRQNKIDGTFFFSLAMINNCKSSFARNESFIIIFFFLIPTTENRKGLYLKIRIGCNRNIDSGSVLILNKTLQEQK